RCGGGVGELFGEAGGDRVLRITGEIGVAAVAGGVEGPLGGVDPVEIHLGLGVELSLVDVVERDDGDADEGGHDSASGRDFYKGEAAPATRAAGVRTGLAHGCPEGLVPTLVAAAEPVQASTSVV